VAGEIFDVAVDLRRKSPTFGRWTSARLSEGNRYQFFVPPGMAHGFCVLSDFAELEYKCTDVYFPEYERSLAWDDPTLAIGWPVKDPLLSKRDSRGSAFGSDPYYEDMGA
jgi:dTDP-4-dehydrorhamnose 3,5-epimerase